MPEIDQRDSYHSLVPVLCDLGAANFPLIRLCRGNHRSHPRRIGVRLGMVEPSLCPHTPNPLPLITGRQLGRLQPDNVQGPPNLTPSLVTEPHFRLDHTMLSRPLRVRRASFSHSLSS
jgi:hypothetical protein